jgi:hypothetical protein
MEAAGAANLDNIISTQKSDGGWGLTWLWEERNPAAWKRAVKEWRGVVTLEVLQTLEAFHRIAPLKRTNATMFSQAHKESRRSQSPIPDLATP